MLKVSRQVSVPCSAGGTVVAATPGALLLMSFVTFGGVTVAKMFPPPIKRIFFKIQDS